MGEFPQIRVLRGTLRTFSLNPPMILVLVHRSALGGPGQARFAGAGRAAPARTLRVRSLARGAFEPWPMP